MENPGNQELIGKIWYDEKAKALTEKNDFGSAAKLLLEQQKRDWKQLADGFESLTSVQTKEFEFDGFKIKVQFNPLRIRSTSAKVDEKSINERECFLCWDKLPQHQKGILFGNEYLIIGNPFPIFPEHFTIPNINHFPQSIKEVFHTMLQLSRSLSKFYTVFYNGPKCGASAPDHLHFQAGSKFFMPIEEDFITLKRKYGEILFEDSGFSASAIDDGMRRFISIEGDIEETLIHSFNSFYGIYSQLVGRNEEPMMNVLCSYSPEEGWRVIIFLREKHRPSCYFLQGEKNILISPAAVDLGGICITPLEKDFEKITGYDIAEIFREVFIGKEYFDFIKTKLKESLSR